MVVRRLRRSALVLISLVALGLVGCSNSGFQYVKSEEAGTIFKVPNDWSLFREDEALGLQSAGISPQVRAARSASEWAVAFDSSPKPSMQHVFDRAAPFPAGYAHARVLTDRERDSYSLKSMRNEVYPIDDLSTIENIVEPVDSQEIVEDDGFRGLKQTYTLRTETGGFYTFQQITMVDPSTSIAYVFVIGCEANCYEQNQEVINEVMDSWQIKDIG
jgi:hypothetical protein